MSTIGKQWNRFSKWYDGLSSWKKVLFFIPFIVVAAILFTAFVLSVSDKPEKNSGDAVVDQTLTDDTKQYVTEKKKLDAELKAKKLVEISLINQTTTIDKKALDNRNAIRDAKTIEEVDAILKGMK